MNGVPLYAKNTNVHFDDMTTVDATIDILADVDDDDDDNTIDDGMDTDINVDAVHTCIYTWTRLVGERKTLLDPGA